MTSRTLCLLVGAADVESLGLPLFTVIVGLVDGFNPCATWVLLQERGGRWLKLLSGLVILTLGALLLLRRGWLGF